MQIRKTFKMISCNLEEHSAPYFSTGDFNKPNL